MIGMRRSPAVFLALVLFSTAGFAADSLWSVGGPEGANVTVLAADPQHPTTIYAGTLDGGIWKTTDGAAHWTAGLSGLPTFSGGFLAINAIAVDPTVSARVYAATNRGLFESDDGGKTWTESGASVLEGRFLNAIAIDSESSSTVFVGASSGVYRSTDAGASWSLSSSGLVDSGGHTPNVLSLAIDPRDSRGMIAGTHDGTFASIDGGATWTSFGGTALDGVDVTHVVFDPSTENAVYALSPETGLFHLVPSPTSSVAGVGIANPGWFKAFWEEIAITAICGPSPCYGMLIVLPPPEPLGPARQELSSTWPLATAPAPEILIGTSGRGLYHSLDGGSTFAAINSGLPSLAISAIVGDGTSSTRWAGSGVAGVAKTTDDTHWAAANRGLFASEVYAVAAAKSSPAVAYAATGSSIFKTVNAGVSWQNLTSIGVDQQVWPALAVDPTNPSIVYAATDEKGVLVSTDGGASWNLANTGIPTTAIDAFAVVPSSPETVYAGTDSGIFESGDGGVHWTALPDSASIPTVRSLAIDPVSVQTVFAGTDQGIFRSTDGGAHWSDVTPSNSFLQTQIHGIAIDPAAHTHVYLATQRGVWKSTDGGGSWTEIDGAIPSTFGQTDASAIVIEPGTPVKIDVASVGVQIGEGNGVYQSTDGGATWTALSAGLTNGNVAALAVSSGSTPILYAGTVGGGVFRSPAAAPPPPPGKRKIIPVHPARPKTVRPPRR